MDTKSENPQIYPRVNTTTRHDDWTEYEYFNGMTLLDYFAGQYMANGCTPEESYQKASIAIHERQRYLK